MSDVFAGLPCTDVDICMLYALGDFATAVSKAERVAYGEDGAIAPPSFALTSAFPFATQGVQVGHVCVLDSYTSGIKTIPLNDVLAVSTVADGTLTLARIGYPVGQGAYLGKGTAQTAVKFFVPSLVAQIAAEYAEVKRMLGVITDADLINPTDLKVITILKVLRPLYFAQSRQVNDIYWAKAQDLDKQIQDELATLWKTYTQGTELSHRPVAAFPTDMPNWRVPRDYSVNDWTENPPGQNYLY